MAKPRASTRSTPVSVQFRSEDGTDSRLYVALQDCLSCLADLIAALPETDVRERLRAQAAIIRGVDAMAAATGTSPAYLLDEDDYGIPRLQ